MPDDHIRRLVGGYATGSLTESQRKLLFEAALEDQELFEELAAEQPLKELLEAPGVRQRLLTLIIARPERPWWMHPLPWAMAGSALAISAVLLGIVYFGPSGSRPKQVEVAQVRPPAPTEAPVSPQPRRDAVGDRESAAQPRNEIRNSEPASAPAPASTARQLDATEPAASPQAKVQNEPAQDLLKSEEAKTQEAQTTQAKNLEERAAQNVAPAAIAGRLGAPPPPAAPPPQAAGARAKTGDGTALGGFAAPSPARAFSAKVPPLPGRFAFDYSIRDGVLRILPDADGYLMIRATVGPIDRLLLPTAHLTRTTPAELKVPDGAGSIVILFSVRPIPEDAADDAVARATPRTDAAATIEDLRPSVNTRLAVRIGLSVK